MPARRWGCWTTLQWTKGCLQPLQCSADQTFEAARCALPLLQVLLLDEITVDMDVVGRLDLLQFFRQECEERGATIVYVSPCCCGLFYPAALGLGCSGWQASTCCTGKPGPAALRPAKARGAGGHLIYVSPCLPLLLRRGRFCTRVPEAAERRQPQRTAAAVLACAHLGCNWAACLVQCVADGPLSVP